MCFEQRGHAHDRDEASGSRQHFPRTLASDRTPRRVAERCRNPEWRQGHYQPRRCGYAKWVANRLGECGICEAPVNQTRPHDCQQKGHRPVARGSEKFREERVLKLAARRFWFACVGSRRRTT